MRPILLVLLLSLTSAACRDYQFPKNLGGQWLILEGHVENKDPAWLRILHSTSIYVDEDSGLTNLSIGSASGQAEIKGGFGAGLQWRVDF